MWYVTFVGIASERPETGVRIAIERARDGGPPWAYAGSATSPAATFPLTVTVSADGGVVVELAASQAGDAPPSDLAEKVRLIVRTAYRQAAADGDVRSGLPLRIVRWRADRADPAMGK